MLFNQFHMVSLLPRFVLLLHCNIQATKYYSLVCKGINTITTKKSLNHVALNHIIWHATLQNIELTIYQETIQLAQIKLFPECTYNTDTTGLISMTFCRARKSSIKSSRSRGVVIKLLEDSITFLKILDYHSWQRKFCDFRPVKNIILTLDT